MFLGIELIVFGLMISPFLNRDLFPKKNRGYWTLWVFRVGFVIVGLISIIINLTLIVMGK